MKSVTSSMKNLYEYTIVKIMCINLLCFLYFVMNPQQKIMTHHALYL